MCIVDAVCIIKGNTLTHPSLNLTHPIISQSHSSTQTYTGQRVSQIKLKEFWERPDGKICFRILKTIVYPHHLKKTWAFLLI